MRNNNSLKDEFNNYQAEDNLLSGDYLEVKEMAPIKKMVNELEKLVIDYTLQEEKSLRKAAKVLGVSHTTVLNKAKKYNLQ